jgi:hypothetical protein
MIPVAGVAEATGEELERRRRWAATGVIALLVLLTRVPYFFVYMIDPDESTYVLMGRSLFEGHLPYIQLWDAKPPLAFVLAAGFMAGPGNDVVQLRLWGSIIVFVSAMLVHSIVRRSVNLRLATPAALLFVIGCAVTRSGQATMMEYVALPFLLGALRVLIDAPVSAQRALVAGGLVAAAALVRLNLGFVAPALGLLLLFRAWNAGPLKAIGVAASFAAGGCIVLGLVAFPYWVGGNLELFVRSCLGAGMSHSATQLSWANALTLPIERTLGLRYPPVFNRAFILALLVWLPAMVGGVYVAWRYRRLGHSRRHAVQVLGAGSAAVALSILLTGIFYERHTLQLLPFAVILASITYQRLCRRGKAWRVTVLVAASLAAALALKPVPQQWKRVLNRAQDGELMAGPVKVLADYLHPRCGEDCSVFLMIDHLGYWLLDKPLPTKIAHPANLAVPYVYTLPGMRSKGPEEEFTAIFAGKPDYVVIRSAKSRRPRVDDGTDLAMGHLPHHYRKVHEYGSGTSLRDVYQLRPGSEAWGDGGR